jgi:hypothetical protein
MNLAPYSLWVPLWTNAERQRERVCVCAQAGIKHTYKSCKYMHMHTQTSIDTCTRHADRCRIHTRRARSHTHTRTHTHTHASNVQQKKSKAAGRHVCTAEASRVGRTCLSTWHVKELRVTRAWCSSEKEAFSREARRSHRFVLPGMQPSFEMPCATLVWPRRVLTMMRAGFTNSAF